MPKISFIIPAYNAEKVVGRCIESVLSQTFKDFELIVLNDGSKDQTGAVCDEYAAKDDRIRVIHKENSGVSDTRNQGIDLARGEYVQFLDADDWIVPEAAGLFVQAMEDHPCDLVISDFYRVVNDWTSQKGSIDTEGLLSREEFADWMSKSPADYYYGVLWNKLYKRSILKEYQVQMDRSLRFCEDFLFNLEYLLHTGSIYVLRVPTYYYVKTEGSLVSQGMKFSNVVRMKLNVIEYYTNFYKQIFSEKDYNQRRLEIYSYLVEFSHDEFTTPILPGTKRLGKERTTTYHEQLPDSFWTTRYYEQRLEERMLHQIASRFDLDYHAVRVLLFLHRFGKIEDLQEAASFAQTNLPGVYYQLGFLYLNDYIFMEKGLPKSAVLARKSDDLCMALDHGEAEVELAMMKGFSEEEKALYRELRLRSLHNLQETLEK